MRGRRAWLTVVVLLLLHFSLHPLWSRWPVGPDLVAAGLLLGSFLLRWGRASVLGCVLGVLEASIALGSLGITMLLFSLAGGIASWLHRLIYSESRRLVLVFVFVGTWVLRAVAASLTRGDASLEALLLHAPASAALTVATCWLIDRLAWIGARRSVAEGLR